MLDAKCRELLAEAGFPFLQEHERALEKYFALIREWNAYASLVSAGDLGRLEQVHAVDSLSLAPVIAAACGPQAHILDVGSGGGFPALPLRIVMVSARVTLVERSSRRVGFLRKVVGALGLAGVRIVQGEFPGDVRGEQPDVITARAVDRPGRILAGMREFVAEGVVFLCQLGAPDEHFGPAFHVERVEDAWKAEGLRRGELYLVRRRQASA